MRRIRNLKIKSATFNPTRCYDSSKRSKQKQKSNYRNDTRAQVTVMLGSSKATFAQTDPRPQHHNKTSISQPLNTISSFCWTALLQIGESCSASSSSESPECRP